MDKKNMIGNILVSIFVAVSIFIFTNTVFAQDMLSFLKKKRIEANEKATTSNLATLASAFEAYYAEKMHSSYPQKMEDLVNAPQPFLPGRYLQNEQNGYRIHVDYGKQTYAFLAEPVECGVTGVTIFRLSKEDVHFDKMGNRSEDIKKSSCLG
jgi:hypothetical protein